MASFVLRPTGRDCATVVGPLLIIISNFALRRLPGPVHLLQILFFALPVSFFLGGGGWVGIYIRNIHFAGHLSKQHFFYLSLLLSRISSLHPCFCCWKSGIQMRMRKRHESYEQLLTSSLVHAKNSCHKLPLTQKKTKVNILVIS